MFSKSNSSISALLVSSLLLTIGRGATLPFMAIYLTRQYQMPVNKVGLAISVALTIGVLFSMGFGILADKFDKKRYMLLAVIAFICGFIAIPLINHAGLVVVFISLINCSYSVFSTVLKGYFADTLPTSTKAKVFSLNYTFINIGWTIGPPIGTWLLMYSTHLPFWLAAVSASVPIVFIQRYVQSVSVAADSDRSATVWEPAAMLRDRALAWFVLSTFLGSLVFGSFSIWISQYVLTVADSALAEAVIGLVLPVNAAVVVTLQYAVGRRIRPENLKKLMTLGSFFFLMGLSVFMIADKNLYLWGVAAVIFTLGELIYSPGEYILIDNIAPEGMKSSYFSAQALGLLGGAFNPVLSGVVLTELPPQSLFIILMGISFLAWFSMLKGMSIKPLFYQ
ncbi:efflux MFS transporter YdeE [Xenorhabdus sp. DI]|uniref:efflux MFS transporter YdeE n=1 Tax=Xenorhabdus doucetiae TaxID=351671 RepID=UPI00199748F4|nr:MULTISPECIES: efflux MFS transporter YdeE [unclassified Xenorhabdus]MBD2786119.1 efflux MFS transporter YdeE [Xenorhabdus sp. 3]MBD2788680.1 efflux MFS transporter YdeE [Xenorhabdus sp. DI]